MTIPPFDNYPYDEPELSDEEFEARFEEEYDDDFD